ncbi:MAG: TolC family protein [Planctomycetota bacterium]
MHIELTTPPPPVGDPAAAPPVSPTGTVTLHQALAAALMLNPQLAAYAWETRIADARILQAGLLPNPELEAGIEGVGEEGGTMNFDDTETTIRLSQLLELGGQRGKRVRVAEIERTLADWDYTAKRLDVIADTATAFVQLLAAQEQVALAERLQVLSDAEWSIASERVKSGKAAPTEELQSRAVASAARLGVGRARRELEAARVRLAATWGGRSAAFERGAGQLRLVEEVPPFEDLIRLLTQTPEVARWATEMEHRRAVLAQANALGLPSLSLSVGATEYRATGDRVYGLGLAVPLPVFDRNQGARREALLGEAQGAQAREAEEIRIRTAFSDAYQTLASAFEQARGLDNEVLPAAQAAFDAVNESYRVGKSGYFEVLSAQRTLFEAEEQLLDALTSYHTTKFALERLLGQGLSPVQAGE